MFYGLSTLLVIAYGCLTWQQLRYGLEFDESYNLTVVKNFAEGHGYATTGIGPVWHREFDPNASTGPTLLIPGALFWYLSSGTLWVVRLVPLVFFAVYLGSLGWLFTMVAGRWAGLIAISAPLVMSVGTADLSTASLVPGRYVGEVTAVAFAVLMATLLYREMPLLAGMAGGLAIQAKLNFALPIAVIALAWLAGRSLRHEPGWGVRLLRLGAGLVIPVLAFEVLRLAELGPRGYVVSVQELALWLTDPVRSGQGGGALMGVIAGRLNELAPTLSDLGALLLFTTMSLLVGVPIIVRFVLDPLDSRRRHDSTSTAARLLVGLLGSAVTILAWWALLVVGRITGLAAPFTTEGALLLLATLSVAIFTPLIVHFLWASADAESMRRAKPSGIDATLGLFGASIAILASWALGAAHGSSRVGLPAILLGAPVILVAGYLTIAAFMRRAGLRPGVPTTSVALVIGVVTGVLIAGQALSASRQDFGARLLEEQRGAAQALKDSGTPSLPTVGTWNLASLQILSGVPSDTKPGVGEPTVLVFDSIRARLERHTDDARAFTDECATPLYSSQAVLICARGGSTQP
jgi:hypothetical protein